MKKILLTLSFVFTILMMNGQGLTLNISGNVTDAIGNGIPNYPVNITSDTTMGFIYFSTATTNSSGNYSQSIALPPGVTQGAFYVSTMDSCTGQYYSQTVFFSSNMLNATGINFSMCQASSSCATSFTHSINGSTVSFISSATGGTAPYTYVWSFGDGSNSTSANPTHTYNVPSSVFQVCLTITDATGCTATFCDAVILNTGSSCQAGFTSSTQGNTVSFTNTSTGGNPFFPLLYTWDFGDGNFGFTQNPTHTYAAAGTYLACLTAFDSLGCFSVYCDTIVIGNGGSTCSAYFTHMTTPGTGIIYFTGSASGGTGPYLYSWDFGDGNTSNAQSPSHLYNTMGTYNVCLTITDATGCAATYCDSLFAFGGGSNCSVSFTYQTNPLLGTISFVSNPVGSAPFSYLWDFGDGNTSTQANPNHTYALAGTYMVTLTITDNNGCTSTYTGLVISGGSGQPCQVTYNYMVAGAGSTVSFSATGTGGLAPYSYLWDFGDGNTGSGQSPTHTYAANGVYGACVTMFDSSGCVAVYCDTIVIGNGGSFGTLSGVVIADSLFPALAEVQLIAYDSSTSSFSLIAVTTTVQGTFNFTNVPSGDYLLRAKLLPADPNYANYLPTYYDQTLYWNTATTITVNPNIFQFIVHPLVQGSNSGNTSVGQNFIGGTVTLSIWRGGGPAPDVPVFIMEQDMTPFGYTYTDVNGDYDFSNLPDGVYYIYVEHTGLLTTPIQVTVNNGTPVIDNVDFEIDDYYVAFTDTEKLNSIEQLNIFPNPVQNQLNVRMTLTQNMDVNVSVMNATGQMLRQSQHQMASGQNDVVVPTSDLPAGVYMLRLETNEGVVTEKFVKQ
jgi:PKD repeat protein